MTAILSNNTLVWELLYVMKVLLVFVVDCFSWSGHSTIATTDTVIMFHNIDNHTRVNMNC